MADPIIINDNTLEGQITTLVRYVLTAFGGYALGKGLIDNDTLNLVTGFVTVAIPAAWGLWKTYQHKKQAIDLADAAPNALAKVIGR
jgi:hypothetical protein